MIATSHMIFENDGLKQILESMRWRVTTKYPHIVEFSVFIDSTMLAELLKSFDILL